MNEAENQLKKLKRKRELGAKCDFRHRRKSHFNILLPVIDTEWNGQTVTFFGVGTRKNTQVEQGEEVDAVVKWIRMQEVSSRDAMVHSEMIDRWLQR